jgi:acyl carrier protein
MELQDRLNRIFCEVFDEDDIKISSEQTANDIEGWDSLTHVNLIVAIESKFNISFSHKELMTFKNVGDLLNSIRSKVTA